MPVGSHKDAFKAHQLVKKLIGKNSETPLAHLAADILLDFVKNHRQVSSDFMLETLPEDPVTYNEAKLDRALEAVESLCQKCAENHVNGCFVNQTRRILIAAKTRIDLGSDFNGAKGLDQLLKDAESIGSLPASSKQKKNDACPYTGNSSEKADIPESYAELRKKYEELLEKDIFRSTLIEEIVETIRSVSEGNFETEMPVHEDAQLGQIATAFNLMLRTINKSMSRLDCLVAKRTSELNRSLKKVEEANRHITDSIQYARMIQRSLLPNPENIRTFLPNSFFIWMPKDIVGGDFIFTDYVQGGFIIAVIDCTGHGVPGAFMTLIATFGMRKIIKDEGWNDPAQILKRLSFIVKTTLHQDTDYALSDDGLDASVCFVSGQSSVVSGQSSVVSGQSSVATMDNRQLTTDNGQLTTDNRQLTFAGARLPLIYVCNDKLTIIKGDKKSVGYKRSDLKFNFTNHTIHLKKEMSFYMFTDGFADQLGGKRDRRFGTRRLERLLKENYRKPVEKQQDILLQAFNDHKGENERQDDVTMIGFKI
ncbi:SpoIIE family protein phosphatase [Desulfobacterales bacterium HSG2]|nr:SpoIIE family protein phosphatase [Desulfobacterales bacterium HSG2]